MTVSTSHTPSTASRTVQEVDAVTLSQWLSSGQAVLVDVREASEHQAERIAGAVLRPLSRFDAQSLPEAGDKRLVLHCKAGSRSRKACDLAAAAGRGPVWNLAGGIQAWKQAGLATVASDRSAAGGVACCGLGVIDVQRQTQLVIGLGTLAGTLLGVWVWPWFLVLPAFMGAGLAMAGLSGRCPLASGLAAMPWNRSPANPGTGSDTACGIGAKP